MAFKISERYAKNTKKGKRKKKVEMIVVVSIGIW